MGVLKNKRNRNSTVNYKEHSLRTKTKGQRLRWKSVKNLETVELKNVLTEGKVVVLNSNNKPMLVP